MEKSPMAKSIRVVVVDPHPIFRKGVIATLQRSEELMLVGEGATINDARRLLRDKSPDLLVLEIAIPEGVDVAEEVVRNGAKCVVLTALDDVLSVSTALAVGVSGYILKGVSGLDLIKALKAVHAGQRYATPELAFRLLEVSGDKGLGSKREGKRQGSFSPREQELLEHITKGLTNQEIARKLGLSQGTIKYYLSQLFKKMRVRNRLQAIIAARNQPS
jgi:two-component system, NarL family, nitrate/nitrite response regulator NarL